MFDIPFVPTLRLMIVSFILVAGLANVVMYSPVVPNSRAVLRSSLSEAQFVSYAMAGCRALLNLRGVVRRNNVTSSSDRYRLSAKLAQEGLQSSSAIQST